MTTIQLVYIYNNKVIHTTDPTKGDDPSLPEQNAIVTIEGKNYEVVRTEEVQGMQGQVPVHKVNLTDI